MICKDFLPIYVFLFIHISVYFKREDISNFDDVPITNLFFYGSCLVSDLRNFRLIQGLKSFLLCLLAEVLEFSFFTFGHMIHFELIFNMIWFMDQSWFFHILIYSCSSSIYWEVCPLPWITFYLCWKSVVHRYVDLFLDPILSQWFICLFWQQYHNIWIIVALYKISSQGVLVLQLCPSLSILFWLI